MRTNRLTSKTTPPQKTQTTKGVTVSNTKSRRMIPASELEAQDKAFKTSSENYEAQMNTYRNSKKGEKVYSQFSGGPVDVSPAGLAQYNKTRDVYEPEVTRIERPKGGGTEADFLSRIDKKGGFVGHVTYKEPKKSEPADWSKVELNKMPTKKATISAPKGKLRDMKTQEFGQFEAPSAVTTKTKTKAAMTGGGDKLVRAKNPSGSLGAARVTTEKTKGAAGYNREKKQFEAFAKPLPSGGSLNVMEDTSPVIKRAQTEAKQMKGAYRKEGNREGVKMMGAEAKQLGKAAKFADKMYDRGGGDYFTRDMVKGFRGSDANPANQNTIQRQEQLLNKRK